MALQGGAGAGEPPVPPRRLRNDSYLGAIQRDNIMVRAGLQVNYDFNFSHGRYRTPLNYLSRERLLLSLTI